LQGRVQKEHKLRGLRDYLRKYLQKYYFRNRCNR